MDLTSVIPTFNILNSSKRKFSKTNSIQKPQFVRETTPMSYKSSIQEFQESVMDESFSESDYDDNDRILIAPESKSLKFIKFISFTLLALIKYIFAVGLSFYFYYVFIAQAESKTAIFLRNLVLNYTEYFETSIMNIIEPKIIEDIQTKENDIIVDDTISHQTQSGFYNIFNT